MIETTLEPEHVAHGELTVSQAGRLGGQKLLARYGLEHFIALGKLGGAKVAEQRGPSFYKRIGKLGHLHFTAS